MKATFDYEAPALLASYAVPEMVGAASGFASGATYCVDDCIDGDGSY